MHDFKYGEMKEFIKRVIQNWGADYNTEVIAPTIQSIAIPQVVRKHPWKAIRRPYSKTLTVSTDVYALPYDFEKFLFLSNKYGRMTEVTKKDYIEMVPDKTNRNGQDIRVYYVEDYQGVYANISTAETLNIVSDNSGDTATVLIRGDVGGLDDYEEVVLSGTSAQTTTKTFTSIRYISKSEVGDGIVTVSGTTSSTVFSKLAPEHLVSQYKRLVLDAYPQEALVLTGEYISDVYRPRRDDDPIVVPADLVIMHVLAFLGWERRDATLQLAMIKALQTQLEDAIYMDSKSYNIESTMQLSNSRRLVRDDNPVA